MSERKGWTRQQLLIAFKLYTELPFGRMHARNPEIIRYAGLIDRTPSALAMKLTNIASLDPIIRNSGRSGLTGASAADRAMWNEMQSNWETFVNEMDAAEANLIGTSQTAEMYNHASEINNIDKLQYSTDFAGLDRLTVTKVRIGQNFFRRAVLSAYDSQCCISGLSVPAMLVASHIVPWRIDPENRLNPSNGLCLSVLHDRAFDLGIITIDSRMSLQVASRFSKQTDSFFETTVGVYAGLTIKLPEKFAPKREFLDYHRQNIFLG